MRHTLIAIAVAGTLATGAAHAGANCEAKPPSADTITKAMSLALKTQNHLDAEYKRNGTKVVMLARVGQDLSKYNQHYSHLGWAYRQADGKWRVAHKLNSCGTAEGYIYRQGLGEFFLDDLYLYEAGISVPSKDVQNALYPVLTSRQVLKMQHVPYNMLSYAWNDRYQQSNQWGAETLAYAMEPKSINTRAQAQAWMKLKGYTPSTLELGPLTRLGGRVTRANIAFDDHPNERRFNNQIDTITVDSVAQWMQRNQFAQPIQVLR